MRLLTYTYRNLEFYYQEGFYEPMYSPYVQTILGYYYCSSSMDNSFDSFFFFGIWKRDEIDYFVGDSLSHLGARTKQQFILVVQNKCTCNVAS